MKAILISIQSPHACNILNLIKLWEIRKKFPKDYVGWVYIYVTKALPHLAHSIDGDYEVYDDTQWDKEWLDLNGKVCARFWCDRVDEFYDFDDDLCEQACLDRGEMLDYLGNKNGYAIHITKLEVFDKPKEISEFSIKVFPHRKDNLMTRYLTRAPQSYCYVEVE